MKIGHYEFEFVETIEPKRNEDGEIWMAPEPPQNRYKNKKGLELHEYGNRDFCKFKLKNAKPVSGVYAWVIEGAMQPIYIGETNNFKKRFCMGYGTISPRNCYKGGQKTNCKMNHVVWKEYSNGRKIDIYFYETDEYKKVEVELLSVINTQYNTKNNKIKKNHKGTED